MTHGAEAIQLIERHVVDPECVDVAKFHLKMGVPVAVSPDVLPIEEVWDRVRFLHEELDELRAAIRSGSLVDQADALVDLVYVAKGTALRLGLPWAELWAEVQRANMAKVPGPTKRGMRYDVTKPPGWTPPDLAGVLARHGYPGGEK